MKGKRWKARESKRGEGQRGKNGGMSLNLRRAVLHTEDYPHCRMGYSKT